MLCVPAALNAQDITTVQVGDGATTSYAVPFNSLYGYSFVEQVFPASEIGMTSGGYIQTISFNMQNESDQTDHITVYMKNVSRISFTSNTDYEPVSAADIVYSGDFTFAQGWCTITLDVPFSYDGTSNLMVAVLEDTPGYGTRYFYKTDTTGAAISFYSDNYIPDPYNLGGYEGSKSVRNFRNNIQLGIVPTTVITEIGTGDGQSLSLPVNMFYNYSLSQQIYTADEIGVPKGGTIQSIAFDYLYTNAFSMEGIQVYMMNVDKSFYANNTDMVQVSASDKVFGGTFSASGPGWVSIDLDTPFDYDGTSNLLVCIYDTTHGYPGSSFKFAYTETTDTMALSYYSDNYVPDINDVTSYSGAKILFPYRSNIKLVIEPLPENTVQIGHGNSNSSYLPSYFFYNYSMTQQIYTSEEVGRCGTIRSISFHKSGAEVTRNYDIYLLHTTKTSFNGPTDWVPVSANDLVFSGDVTFENNDWTTITLSTPFEYYGNDNLLLVVDDNSGSYQSSSPFLVFNAPNQAMRIYNDNTNYDPTNPSNYNGTLMNVKNQIRLGFFPSSEVTAYDGTDQCSYVPIYGFYCDAYLKAEYVMNASALTDLANKRITGMTYYATQENKSWGNANFKVFLKEVSSTSISSFTGYENATVVYEGPLSIVDGKMTVNFTTSYAYGGGNLLVGVYNTVTGTYASSTWIGTTVEGASVEGYSYSDLESVTPTQRNFVPKTSFLYSSAPAIITCPAPSSLTVTNISGTSATLNWTENGTATSWDICINNDESNAITVTTNPYTLTGLSEHTSYTVKVRANCGGSDGTSEWVATSFTTPYLCPAPTSLSIYNISQTSATLSWTESGSATAWQICVNGNDATPVTATTNPFILTGLTPNTPYTVKVRANCGGSDGVSLWTTEGTFYTVTNNQVQSTANWYGYACNALAANGDFSEADWVYQFISFSMQNPSTSLTAATNMDVSASVTYAAAYANGYVWSIYLDGSLNRATVNNNTQTLSEFETVIPNFESSTVRDMAYNPVDGQMYYLTSSNTINSFNPSNPSNATTIGTLGFEAMTLAINNAGEAYSVGKTTGELYQVDLSNANSTLKGNTGLPVNFVQSMAFDLNTGELFWAQYYNRKTSHGLYLVNPATAAVQYLGRIGEGGCELTAMFMVSDNETSCFAPSNFTVSNIGPHSAELSWTESNGASSWQICVNGDEANAITVNTNPYTLTNLTPETSYTVKVRSNCGGLGYGYWSIERSFTTPEACPTPTVTVDYAGSANASLSWTGFGDTYTVRYRPSSDVFSDDFENGLGQWTQIDADGDGYGWSLGSEIMSTGYGHNGSSDLALSQSYSNEVGVLYPDNYLVTPQVPLNGHVEFWASAQDSGYPSEHFGVAVSTAGNTDAADFTTIAEWTMTAKAQGNWYHYTVDLSSYNGQLGYVAIRHFNSSDMFYLNIDDFVIFDDNSVTHPWQTITVNANSTILSGLTPTTQYEVQVQSNCGSDGTSGWSDPIYFMTLEEGAPAYATITGPHGTCEGALVTLTANTDVTATYLWSNGATTQTITVGPGTYSVTVTSTAGIALASEPFTVANGQNYTVTDTKTICSSQMPYTWNGITFTEAGVQAVMLETVYGCDSVVTMILTVNPSSSSELNIQTSDSCFAWNGHTYCESGDYTLVLQNAVGCDSVVTLHLSVNVGVESYDLTNVRLAPNPTKNVCRIVGLETDPDYVDIYDMYGKLVMRRHETEFDVSTLRSGMYMVKVCTGDKVVNLKLIRQ